MRIAGVIGLFLVVGCERAEKKEEPVPLPVPGKCERYIAMLEAAAERSPPESPFGDVVVSPRPELAIAAGSRSIPQEDEHAVNEAMWGGVAAGPGEPPRAYLFARDSSTVGELRRRLGPHRQAIELRLLVAKMPAEAVAEHLAVVPETPPDLRERLPGYTSIDMAGEELAPLMRPCEELRKPFRRSSEGGSLDEMGRGAADALRACECKLDDLDGFVSLLTWILLPYPRIGYVTIRPDVLASMPGEQTVDDLVAALAR